MGYYVSQGLLKCRNPKDNYGLNKYDGEIVIDRTTLKLDNSLLSKAFNVIIPWLGWAIGNYSDVSCEVSNSNIEKMKKVVIPFNKLKKEYKSHLESKKAKNKI